MRVFEVTVHLGHDSICDEDGNHIEYKKVETVEEVCADEASVSGEDTATLLFHSVTNLGIRECVNGYGPGEWVKFKVKE